MHCAALAASSNSMNMRPMASAAGGGCMPAPMACTRKMRPNRSHSRPVSMRAMCTSSTSAASCGVSTFVMRMQRDCEPLPMREHVGKRGGELGFPPFWNLKENAEELQGEREFFPSFLGIFRVATRLCPHTRLVSGEHPVNGREFEAE